MTAVNLGAFATLIVALYLAERRLSGLIRSQAAFQAEQLIRYQDAARARLERRITHGLVEHHKAEAEAGS